jgi:hypothetical protein
VTQRNSKGSRAVPTWGEPCLVAFAELMGAGK